MKNISQHAGTQSRTWIGIMGERGWCCLGSRQAHSQMLVRHASMKAAETLRGTRQLSLPRLTETAAFPTTRRSAW